MSTTQRYVRHSRFSLQRTLGRALLWLTGICTVYVAIVTYTVSTQSHIDETREADAAIVLGAAMWAGTPSPVLRARLDHALALYRTQTVTYIIVTGGVGNGDNISEAEGSANYLIAQGVDPNNILLETQGRSTYQSLVGAATVAPTKNIERVLLVSDPFHMLRSLKMAHDLGFDAYASPTTTSPISTRPLEEWIYMIREALAYNAYILTRQ
jgi:uncharacterized SAM-binding protein YcdF (DUF218 family)